MQKYVNKNHLLFYGKRKKSLYLSAKTPFLRLDLKRLSYFLSDCGHSAMKTLRSEFPTCFQVLSERSGIAA